MTTLDLERNLDRDGVLLSPAAARWVVAGLLLLGAAARVRQYAFGRALWLDEVSLALNIVNRSFGQLLLPLDHSQVAPVGFLLVTKALVTALGESELVFRLLPLLAGVGVMVLFYLLLRRVVGPVGLVIGMCLFACQPELIYYSNEFKQYVTALFAVTLVLWLTVRVFERPDSVGRWVMLGVSGVVLEWFSHAVVFALGGAALVLLVDQARRRRWRKAAVAVVMGVLWAGQFAGSYALFYRSAGESANLRDYWGEGFLPQEVVSLDTGEWMIGAWYTLLHPTPRGGATGVQVNELKGLWGFFLLAGVVALWRRDKRMLLLLLAPVGFLFLAAVLRVYPLADRLVLFVAVFRYALVAAGGAMVIDLVAQRTRGGAALLLAGVVCFPLLAGAYLVLKPMGMEESRDLFRQLAANVEDGQTLYVADSAQNAYAFYAERTGIADVPRIDGVFTGFKHELIHAEADRIAQHGQVWVVTTHRFDRNDLSDVSLLELEMLQRGEAVRQITTWGCAATLYHFPSKDHDPT